MERYYFDLHENDVVTTDLEGLQFESLLDVRVEALRSARSVISAEVNEGKLCLACRIIVRNSEQDVVLVMPFIEAVVVTGVSAAHV